MSRRISLLLPNLQAGGAERVMLLLAREFVARGHAVDLVLLRADGPLLAEVPTGVRVVDLDARSRGLGQLGFALSAVVRLACWLRRQRPPILLSSITGANLIALMAGSISRTRVVVRVAESVRRAGGARRWMMRQLYPRADAVVALSHVMAGDLERIAAVPPSKIHVIRNPVDPTRLREKAQEPLQHQWLDNPQLPVLINVGRLIPEKDLDSLLQAFALLPQDLAARLIIVGDGPERPALEKVAAQLAIADRIALVGFDPNPWRWMARADVFAFSSVSEGCPNALLEALALEMPAVTTEFDGSVRDIAKEYPLEIVPIRDPQALAGALERLLGAGRGHASTVRDDRLPAVDEYLSILC